MVENKLELELELTVAGLEVDDTDEEDVVPD